MPGLRFIGGPSLITCQRPPNLLAQLVKEIIIVICNGDLKVGKEERRIKRRWGRGGGMVAN